MTLFKRTLGGQQLPVTIEQRPEVYRQPQLKVDSPVFGKHADDKRSVGVPVNHPQGYLAHEIRMDSGASRRKIELVFLKLENHLFRMAFLLGSKLRHLKLSEGFTCLKLHRKERKAALSNYTNILIRAKLQAMVRITRERTRMNLQRAFARLTHEHQLRERNVQSAFLRNNDKPTLTEHDRRFDHDIERKNSKLNKRSTLQTDPSKRIFQPANSKENDNLDNLTTLELENRQLRKQISWEEREQTRFVELMTELLDKYDPQLEEPSSTSRPNLTSFCSSPQHFVRGKPTDKQRFFKKH